MDPSPEFASREEGLRLLKAGQIDEAIQVLERLADKGSDDPLVHSCLGVAYSKKEDKVQAIHAFEEALRLQETPKAYFNLAVAYESAGRIDEAVREFKMATELDPNNAPAREALARLHNQFSGVQPPAPAEQAAASTQVMTAAPAGISQTQSFSGPPPGPVAQAPAPIGDPFAQQYSPAPTQADFLAKQMRQAQEIADQHHRLMKNGIIYGAICGSVFIVCLVLIMNMLTMGGLPEFATRGWGLLIYVAIVALAGAIYGCLVGLWIGYTCGGDGAGTQAGAAIGVVMGILFGLPTGSMGTMMVCAIVFGVCSAGVGMIIGRMVDVSISD